jgi:hypothetical protein
LDTEFEEACREDITNLCDDNKNGRDEVVECLRSKKDQLSSQCQIKLFKRESVKLVDQKSDYELVSKCRNVIQQYCDASEDNPDFVGCLRKHLMKPDLDLACRKVVISRIMEQNQDARLNPSLWAACQDDVKMSCREEFVYAQDLSHLLNGKVIKCLKYLFVENRLSKRCEVEVDQVMREAANVDYRLDPLLVNGCLREINSLCLSAPNDKKEDCLRLSFQRGDIQRGSKCFEVIFKI